MGRRHGHPNERHVQFAYRGRRRNYKHCQPVGRPPRYLRARARRERLPGLQTWGPVSAVFLDVTGGPTTTTSATATATATPTATPRPTPTPTSNPSPGGRPTPAPPP